MVNCRPRNYKLFLLRGKLSVGKLSVKGERCLMPLIRGVEMWRIVVIEVHTDDTSTAVLTPEYGLNTPLGI